MEALKYVILDGVKNQIPPEGLEQKIEATDSNVTVYSSA